MSKSSPSPDSRRIFFFNDTATTEIYTLSLHDALPIFIDAEVTDWLDPVASSWMRRPSSSGHLIQSLFDPVHRPPANFRKTLDLGANTTSRAVPQNFSSRRCGTHLLIGWRYGWPRRNSPANYAVPLAHAGNDEVGRTMIASSSGRNAPAGHDVPLAFQPVLKNLFAPRPQLVEPGQDS